MEAKWGSRKRKQASLSSPFAGIFTRSKSQIYTHRNRSGRSRFDSAGRRKLHTEPEVFEWCPGRKHGSAPSQESFNRDDDISRISIKDLRARRVFSPASPVINDEGYPKPDESGGVDEFATGVHCKDRNVDDVNPNLLAVVEGCCYDENDGISARSDDIELTQKGNIEGFEFGLPSMDSGEAEKSDKGFACKSKDPNDTCLNLHEASRSVGFCNTDQPSDAGGEGFIGIDSATEEIVQATPSAADISGKPDVNENGENKVECVLQTPNHDLGKLSSDSISRSKSALNRCSRSKVFKAPNSFSYRRLLPFLMDMEKDNSCAPKNGQCPKLDKDLEVKPLLALQSNKISTDKSSADNYAPELNNGDKNDRIGGCFDGTVPKIGRIEKPDNSFPSKAHDLDDVKSNFHEAEGNAGVFYKEQHNDVEDEALNGTVGLTEECVQMTPPDADIFGKPELNKKGESKVECVLQTTDSDLGKPSNGSIQRSGSISTSKLVLNLRSRTKVFKSPNSFSYRRLLPFLMDLNQDNSCSLKNVQILKLDEGLETTPPPPLLASQSPEISLDKSSADSSPIQPVIGDSETLQAPILNPVNSSSNVNALNLILPKHITESQMPIDSEDALALEVAQVISDGPSNLEFSHNHASSVHGTDSPVMLLCSPTNPEPMHIEDGATEASHCLPVGAEVGCKISGMELTADTAILDQVSSQPGTLVPVGGIGLAKGILKRNPRGCRGLCSCLNCASFYLHAERAFEFSRNQMKDAEEVALELVKELSYLRNMLEKSTTDANDRAVVPINQVKEVCMNVTRAEEVAKTRLSQMNYELDIHCRTTCMERPRVSFANYAEEKVIPKAEVSPSK